MIQILRAQQQRWETWQSRSPNRGIFGAIVTVGGLTSLVRLSGLFKHQLIAYRFGLSDDCDAFIVAFALPAFLAGLVESISQSAFIPTFVSVHKREGQTAAACLFASMMASALALVLVVLALLLVGERPILHLLAGGFGSDKLERVRQLFHWLLPILFLSSVAGLWSSVLNAQGRFALAAVAPLMTPLCPILAMVGFARFGIRALAAGTVLGALVQCAILGVGLHRYRLPIRPRWHGASPALRTLLERATPMLIGALILSSNGIVDQTMASRLAPGSVAALEYGNRLSSFVVGIASMALGTAVLPHFSDMVVERNWLGIRHTLNTYVRWIAVVSVAGTVVLVPLSMSIVRLLLERGAFTEADTRMVSHVQICYLVQAPFYLIGILGVRLLNALGHNRTLVWISSMNVITNLAGNYLLMRVLGLPGIALSTACVYACSMFVILHQVKAKLPCA
ncbi:MAG: Virulence factor MviN [Myxococcales bacterium]|nr:Virulence factor MviN [Myxococcales bacterium]